MFTYKKAAGAARVVPAAFFILAVLSAGCGPNAPERQAFVFEGATMGTTYMVKVVQEEMAPERREEIHAAIRAELDEVNTLMSTYIEDSELSRLNRHAETVPFALSDKTWQVFDTALEISRLSGGALDVTVGPLVNAWGFGPGSSTPDHLPPEMSDEEVAAVLERIGYQKLELVEEPRALVKKQADLYCDLSSVAKGFAVDQVAEALERLGESDFMAEVGGEVRASGTNERGKLWRIGIERPQLLRGGIQRIVALDGMALATSGDYRNYREIDGERFSHIMDPRTGRPIRHRLASVSVVHPSCMMADAWSTTLMVLGEEEGAEVASREGLAALFLVRESDGYRESMSPAFEALTSGEHKP